MFLDELRSVRLAGIVSSNTWSVDDKWSMTLGLRALGFDNDGDELNLRCSSDLPKHPDVLRLTLLICLG